jgi:hypothetical protein
LDDTPHFFYNADEQALIKMAEDCRNGNFQPDTYKIFQFFPNLLVTQWRQGSVVGNVIQQFVPIAHDRTSMLTIMQEPTVLPGGRMAAVRWLAAPLLRRMEQRVVKKVLQEDNAVCEQMYSIVQQLDRPQIFSSQEQRIAWFEENYADVVGDLSS